MENPVIDYERRSQEFGTSADSIQVAKDAGALRLLVGSYSHFLALMESDSPPKRPSNLLAGLALAGFMPRIRR